MTTLEGNARSCYENFPATSICSLKHFHTIFPEKYKEIIHLCCWLKTIVIILKFLFNIWNVTMKMTS